MNLDITPLILTFNEAPNLRRTLDKLTWAAEILVVDSFSTDETLAIAGLFPQVRVVQRSFDTFANQCNFALGLVTTEWVLSLDADYVLSDQLVQDLERLTPEVDVAGYSVRFIYCIDGRRLRASLYPPRTVLYRKDRAQYYDEGHSHRVKIDGPVGPLHGVIYHDDRKPLDRWLHDQNKYTILESQNLLSTPLAKLKLPDRLRRAIVVAPALIFIYTLLAKGLILDGRPGWYYVFQRTLAETLLSLRLIQAGWSRDGAESGPTK